MRRRSGQRNPVGGKTWRPARPGKLLPLGLSVPLVASLWSCAERTERQSLCVSAGWSPEPLACADGEGTCPAGTGCTARPGQRGQCLPTMFPTIDADALTSGFGVPEIELRRTEDAAGDALYEAILTKQVEALACSLFVAEPLLETGDLGYVKDAATSIYRSHMFRIEGSGAADPQTIQFGVGDLTSTPQTSCAQPLLTTLFQLRSQETVAPEVAGYRILSALRIGCIAFSQDRIVGATRLLGVALNELPESQSVLTNCSGQSESGMGRLCMAPQTIGRCVRGECEPLESDALPLSGSGDSGVPEVPNQSGPATPIAACTACTEGQLCAQASYVIGRCMGSRCAQLSLNEWEPPLVVSDCAAPFEHTDGLNCTEPRIQGFGTCYEGICRSRCATNEHCGEAFGILSDEAHVCAHPRGTPAGYLGLCLPSAWFDGSGSTASEATDAGACVANATADGVGPGSAPPRLTAQFCLGGLTCD